MYIKIINNNYIPCIDNKPYEVELLEIHTWFNYYIFQNNGFKYMILDDFKVFSQDKLQDNEIKGIFAIDFVPFIAVLSKLLIKYV